MDEPDRLAERFEAHRRRLQSVAYRMLGSPAEADDAVQEAWLRLSRSGGEGVDNLAGWLTTVVARVCLDMLRSRKARREEPLADGGQEQAVGHGDREGGEVEDDALLADSVGLALLVVLDMLTPAERLAFVLHDMFAVPFDEIAPIVGRSSDAARQLASRARRRVQGVHATRDADRARQRQVVDAFLAASRSGDFDALLLVLDPEVVLRAELETTGWRYEVHGARAVAGRALAFSHLAQFAQPALVNGSFGVVHVQDGRLGSVMVMTIVGNRIVAMDIYVDQAQFADLDLQLIGDETPASPSPDQP